MRNNKKRQIESLKLLPTLQNNPPQSNDFKVRKHLKLPKHKPPMACPQQHPNPSIDKFVSVPFSLKSIASVKDIQSDKLQLTFHMDRLCELSQKQTRILNDYIKIHNFRTQCTSKFELPSLETKLST